MEAMPLYMAPDGDVDTARTHVQTYVPAYQKEEWAREADAMNMSLSEFVRTMTQAGKRGFDEAVESDRTEKSRPTPSSDADSQGSRLEDRVRSVLPEDEYLDWDELVDAVQEDFEIALGEAIDELVAAGEIEHRHGRGYSLA